MKEFYFSAWTSEEMDLMDAIVLHPKWMERAPGYMNRKFKEKFGHGIDECGEVHGKEKFPA